MISRSFRDGVVLVLACFTIVASLMAIAVLI